MADPRRRDCAVLAERRRPCLNERAQFSIRRSRPGGRFVVSPKRWIGLHRRRRLAKIENDRPQRIRLCAWIRMRSMVRRLAKQMHDLGSTFYIRIRQRWERATSERKQKRMAMATVSPLLISHVPKTAGTSLRRMIAAEWPDTVFVYKSELSLLNPSFDDIKRLRRRALPSIIMGHFSFGVHRFLAVPPRYAIVLREPLTRVISLYRHQVSLPDSRFADFLKANRSLRDFVRSGVTEMTNNHMCRMIAGVAPDSGTVIQGRWLLEHARHNLRSFYTLVGTSERMNVFVKHLASMHGMSGLTLPVDNVSTGDYPVLDEKTRKVLLDMNALDCELYEGVRRTAG